MFARLSTGMLLFCLFLCGCNDSRIGPEGNISGKVTYNGKPVPGGWVTFTMANGYTFSGVIDPDGNYKVRPIVGDARIAVDNRMLIQDNKPPDIRRRPGVEPPPGVKIDDKPSAPVITGTYVPLPQKYTSPDTSGLTYTVKSGSQNYNIELTD